MTLDNTCVAKELASIDYHLNTNIIKISMQGLNHWDQYWWKTHSGLGSEAFKWTKESNKAKPALNLKRGKKEPSSLSS